MKAIVVLAAALAQASVHHVNLEAPDQASISAKKDAMDQDHDKYDYFTARHPAERGDLAAAAHDLSLSYVGRVGSTSYRLFRKPKTHGPTTAEILARAQSDAFAKKHAIEEFRVDATHDLALLSLPDPSNAGFKKQWFLQNDGDGDLRVKHLWEKGITGTNVTIAVIDDGVNYLHADFQGKFSDKSSYNVVTTGVWPYPAEAASTHGTNCAGIVAGKKDGSCGTGVAYDARIAGIKLPLKSVSDSQRAFALSFKSEVNDIYSCSWGADLDIDQLYPLPPILASALAEGATKGRDLKGSIYVFASGNKGREHDNCGFSGYLNSIHTITVGAVNRFDSHIDYSEGCSNLLVTAYASDYNNNDIRDVGIRTNGVGDGRTDALEKVTDCRTSLTGRPDLTWRDVQSMLLLSARRVDEGHDSWHPTYAGRHFSNYYGYGVVDGEKIARLLPDYTLLPNQITYRSPVWVRNADLRITRSNADTGYTNTIEITSAMLKNQNLVLEHVVVRLSVQYPSRSLITVKLISPRGFVTDLVTARKGDFSRDGFVDFPVMSLAHWGEPAVGKWTIQVFMQYTSFAMKGKFVSWQLDMYGHAPTS